MCVSVTSSNSPFWAARWTSPLRSHRNPRQRADFCHVWALHSARAAWTVAAAQRQQMEAAQSFVVVALAAQEFALAAVAVAPLQLAAS